MAYFLTDDSTPKGRDPNININSGIHKIKGKTSVNVLVSNYTNKHLTFHKGEYIGHLEPAVMDTIDQQETHQINSVTLKKMTLICYYGNVNLNSQKMKLQLEPYP